jgi:hypothetical protein
MRTTVLPVSFLILFIQAKSQNSEVEIYCMHNDSILKGQLLQCSADSVYYRGDISSFKSNLLENIDY